MTKEFCVFVTTLLLSIFNLGCGFNHYTITTPSLFSSKHGKVNIGFNPLSPTSVYFEGNSYIDFNSLDHENYNYYSFFVSFVGNRHACS